MASGAKAKRNNKRRKSPQAKRSKPQPPPPPRRFMRGRVADDDINDERQWMDW